MRVRLELEDGWRLAGDLSRPEAALAATELETALGPPGENGVEVTLTHADGPGDGFRRRATPRTVELRGESARGLLFGVYEMLEELGEDWPWPGERRARGEEAWLEDRIDAAPALPGRSLVLGERALVDRAEAWIVWAARKRIDWRLPDGATRRILEAHIRDHREADVVHLWGADAPAGSGGREASEAALRAANALAELAETVRPGTRVAFLAYHDTLEVPRGVRPRENVCLVFAPRERCYEHALADPDCRTNARHRDALRALLEHFAAAAAAPPRVFEYWFDAILFSNGVPDLTKTMADDLAFYRQAGVHTVQMLITGHGRMPAPHPNPPAFARLAWDPAAGGPDRP